MLLRRQVCWFDFSDAEGSEPDKRRSCVVVQTSAVRGLGTVLVVPCSSELRRARQPTGVLVPAAESGTHDVVALCHLLCARDLGRACGGPTGTVSEATLQRILLVLCDLLGIDASVLWDP